MWQTSTWDMPPLLTMSPHVADQYMRHDSLTHYEPSCGRPEHDIWLPYSLWALMWQTRAWYMTPLLTMNPHVADQSMIYDSLTHYEPSCGRPEHDTCLVNSLWALMWQTRAWDMPPLLTMSPHVTDQYMRDMIPLVTMSPHVADQRMIYDSLIHYKPSHSRHDIHQFVKKSTIKLIESIIQLVSKQNGFITLLLYCVTCPCDNGVSNMILVTVW